MLRFIVQRNDFWAFTLAEVLITLGIIGVVAALTLPNLIANYQKMVLKNQFKKTYSLLSQNLLKSQVDFGTQPQCHNYTNGCLPHRCAEYNPNGTCRRYEMADGSPLASDVCGLNADCSSFSKSFINNLKVVKVCDKNAYDKKCIAYLKGNDEAAKDNNPDITQEDINKSLGGTSGWYGNSLRSTSIAYVLADGQVLISYSYPFSTKIFAVDINGLKGPNKWGYDIFAFSSRGELGKAIKLGPSGFAEKGGVSTDTMIKNMNN